MKRILLISPMPPRIGGVSISTGRLYENLKEDGYDVDYYDIRPTGKLFDNPIGIILRFFWIPFFILFNKKYDIIHCHVPGFYRKIYISINKFLYKGAKLIFTIHGDIQYLLNNRNVLKALDKADKIICVQRGDTEKLPQNLKIKSSDIPAFILPNKISEDGIPKNIIDFIKNRNNPLILFYGGVVLTDEFYDLYGIQDTITLYNHLINNGISARLLLLVSNKGGAENTNFINQIKDKIRNNDNILFVENASIQMLPLFKYANVYIRPTKTDGDSLAVREALSMNCPVVASNKSKRPEGTTVYENETDFVHKVTNYLTGKDKIEHQPDFYNQIKNVYEFDK